MHFILIWLSGLTGLGLLTEIIYSTIKWSCIFSLSCHKCAVNCKGTSLLRFIKNIAECVKLVKRLTLWQFPWLICFISCYQQFFFFSIYIRFLAFYLPWYNCHGWLGVEGKSQYPSHSCILQSFLCFSLMSPKCLWCHGYTRSVWLWLLHTGHRRRAWFLFLTDAGHCGMSSWGCTASF